MSVFDLKGSLNRAAERLGKTKSTRRGRSDRGRSRLHRDVAARLRAALLGQERPSVAAVLEELRAFCAARGLRPPARATLYQWMEDVPVPGYVIEELSKPVREALYNLPSTGEIPGTQLAFYCFNFGGVAAMSFAAGLPWLTLHQAARRRGWRPGSRGLIEAVLAARGI